MITIRLSMNGESPIMLAGLRIPQRRAGDRGQQRDHDEHGERRPQRVAQAARLAPPATPRARRRRRAVLAAVGRVVRAEPALDELRGDERQHDRDEERRARSRSRGSRRGRSCAFGSASADASLVISVSTPSSGVIRKFTPKPAATPANAAAMPGQRVAADALERGRPEGYQHEVAGVGGDARDASRAAR